MADRWIKAAHGTYAPRCIITIACDVDTVDRSTDTGDCVSMLRRVHVTESHRPYTRWSSPLYRSFGSGDELFDWLEESRSNRRRTYIFCPDAMDVLTLCSFWERIELAGCELTADRDSVSDTGEQDSTDQRCPRLEQALKSPVATDDADIYHFSNFTPGVNAHIIEYRRFGSTFRWCSNFQYIQSTENEVAKSIGYVWRSTDAGIVDIHHDAHSGNERSAMWNMFYRRLSDWWTDNDCGPFSATIASCSYSFLRRRIQEKTILHHDDEEATALEEAAIFAGRRSVWYYGNIGSVDVWKRHERYAPKRSNYGEIRTILYNSDIRSMYPHILATQRFPVKLVEKFPYPSRDTMRDILADYGCIASVVLRTELDEYPVRTNNGIIYPVGVFNTTLCGPELIRAYESNSILYVKHAAIYDMGTPFKEACELLLDMRQKERGKEVDCWEMFIKLLSNAMSGRIALVPCEWKKRPDKAPLQEWGYWPEIDTQTNERCYYRSVAGMTWQRVQTEGKSRPMGAAYAYLCSYGRWIMSCLRSMCPAGSVVSQDTDGLWHTSAALNTLYGMRPCKPTEPGEIALKHTTDAARFYGPQHYWYGDAWVMSGSKSFAHRPGTDDIVCKEKRLGILTSPVTPQPFLLERTVQKNISRVQSCGEISDTGWHIPIRLWTMPDDDAASRY